MKIAIIGAGISGLACALELQKHGVTPDIFEKKSSIGDALDYTLVNLKIFDRFLGSPMGYLKGNYKLNIKSVGNLKKIVMLSPNKQTTVKGNLGYIFHKGQDEKSLGNQLSKNLKVPITYDTHINALKIKNQYDYVIYAGGDCATAKDLEVFTGIFNGHSRIATVIDKFDATCLKMWLNTEYCKQGYAYLLPYSKEKAYLVLTINNISHREIDYYWNKFLEIEKLKFTIVEARDVEHSLGMIRPAQVDNILMTGNAGGCMDSILGFGFINAIESGVMAARSIIKGLDYNKMMEPISKDIRLKHEWRKMINTLDNKDYDKLITLLDLPIIKQGIYNNPFYKASLTAPIIKLYNDHTGKSS